MSSTIQLLLFILSALIVYPLLGSAFALLLTVFPLENQRLKAGLLTLLHSVCYVLFLWLVFANVFNNNLWWASFYFLAVLIRDVGFSKRKYLLQVALSFEEIKVEYLNAALQRRTLYIPNGNIHEMNVSKMGSIADYPLSLDLRIDEDSTISFTILDKKVWRKAKENLYEGKIGLPQ